MAEPKDPVQFYTAGRQNKTGTVFPTQAIADAEKNGGKIDIMSFPNDIGTHQFIMNFVKFTLAGKGTPPNTNVVTSIALPIPGQGISDKIGVKYNQDELGIVGGSMLGAVGSVAKLIDGDFDAENQTGGEFAEQAVKTGLQAAGAAGRQAVNELGMGIGGAADQAFGNVVNPHVVLLFKNVDLKTFTLQWKLAPSNPQESDMLKKILFKIREHSHPSIKTTYNSANFFLNYPDQVDLYYEGVNENLHYFKRSAITGMEVNYQPEGENMFFAGTKAPTRIDLSLTFQETEIWTAEDYHPDEIANPSNIG